MELTVQDKVKEIHKSSLFGSIYEMGAGAPIASALYEQEGASKTVCESIQAYSKEAQRVMFGIENKSVSIEAIKRILDCTNVDYNSKDILHENFIIAASFQLASKDDKKITHGWIGIKYSLLKDGSLDSGEANIEVYFHFTIPLRAERYLLIKLIGSLGIDILYSIATNTELKTDFVDAVFSKEGLINEFCLDKTLQLFLESPQENYLAFQSGKSIRFEELFRHSKGMILQKGSYNPIHEGHLKIMELTKQKYPDYIGCYFISVNRIGKSILNLNELEEKILAINKLGYTVVICKESHFFANMYYLQQHYIKRFNDYKIVFPIGSDTLNRILDPVEKDVNHIYELKNLMKDKFAFDVFKRKTQTLDIVNYEYWEKHLPIFLHDEYEDNGISSTLIREHKW